VAGVRKKSSKINGSFCGRLFEMQLRHDTVKICVDPATLSLQCLGGLRSGAQQSGRDVSHVLRSDAFASVRRNMMAL
jgi:hypothetical protein